MGRLFSSSRSGGSSGGRGFSSRSGSSSRRSLSGRSWLNRGCLIGYRSRSGRLNGLLGGVRNTSSGESGSSTVSDSGLATDSIALLLGDFLRNLASSGGNSSWGSAVVLSDTIVARLTISQKMCRDSHNAPSLDKGTDKVTEVLPLVLSDLELNSRRLSASVGVSNAARAVWRAWF